MTAKPRNVRLAKIAPLKTPTKTAASPQLPTGAKPGTTPAQVPGFKAAAGRPQSNVGRYLIKPTDKSKTGHEMLNTEPQIIEQTADRYLKAYELPPSLQPKYLRKPEVMETQRKKQISKGWVKPRNQVL